MLFLDAGLGHHCCLGLHVHVCSATTATIIMALIIGSVDWFAAGKTIQMQTLHLEDDDVWVQRVL